MKKFLAIFLVACILIMSGCGTADVKKENEKIIAVSFYPIYIFTINLTDGLDGVRVECMAEQSAGCLHDYSLTSKDARLLSDAEVFIINGAGMEGFVDGLDETVENLKIIDSSTGIEFLCEGGGHSVDVEDNHSHSHSHNHAHSENSHIWMSVENAKKQVQNIKNGLILNFPQYEKEIEENYTLYIQRLGLLNDEIKSAGEKVNGKKIVTFHNAYEYLAEDLGLLIVETIESDHGGEPSSKELAHLTHKIRDEKVEALFVEPDYEGSGATILSNETGVEIFTLNPIINGEKEKTAYEDIMRDNLKIILKAVS